MKVLAKLLVLALGTVTQLTGCCTKALWQADAFNNHFEPAPAANAALYRQPGMDDVLVVYDEEKETSGKVHRRAYWLNANERRVAKLEKPKFVSPKLASGLEPIPLEKAGATNTTAGLWAEQNPQGTGFTLRQSGENHGKYILPVYRDKADDVERILLTPGTLTADMGMAAGTLGLFYIYYANSASY